MIWKYWLTNPGRHSSFVLTVQMAQISSAPRFTASSTLASEMNTASMYLSPPISTGGNHIGSETAETNLSSFIWFWVTTSSCFLVKLNKLKVPVRCDALIFAQSSPHIGKTRLRRFSYVNSDSDCPMRQTSSRFRLTGKNGSRLRQLSAICLPDKP